MAVDTDQLKLDIETSISTEMATYTENIFAEQGIEATINYDSFSKAFSPAIMLAVQALIDGEYPPSP
jgi:hypothetical protein